MKLEINTKKPHKNVEIEQYITKTKVSLKKSKEKSKYT